MTQAAERGWRSRAFGIEIEGDFPAPGLPPVEGAPQGPLSRVRVVAADAVDADWEPRRATRLLEERLGGRDPARTIDHLPGRGYRLYARHFGLARVSDDGAEVLCAPPDDEPWSWQRFLVGRTLPWAAVLGGREVFHASAVALDGRAVALIGATGTGKTSLAVHLVLGGGRFLTDDVLALDADTGHVRAHPGAAIVCVRDAELDAMPAGSVERLGRRLGHSGKTYVEVERDDDARPLAGMYFLKRAGATRIERIDRAAATLILGNTFITSIQTPERLRRQLDVAAEIAADVPLFSLAVGPETRAAELAAAVGEHAAAAR